MFNINHMIKKLEDSHTPERVNIAVQNLVKKGILEQFIDENGNFAFQMTEFGISRVEDILKDPMSFFDLDDIDENDGMV